MTDYLESEELQVFIRTIERERDRLLAQFLYESGATISEIATLRASSVKGDGSIHFSDRTAVISPSLAQAILKQAGAYIFASRQDDAITPKRIQQILKPYLTKVHRGKVTPHVLRYTHIVHAYRQGVSIAAISRQTGLTPIRIAQIVGELPPAKEYGFRARLGGSA